MTLSMPDKAVPILSNEAASVFFEGMICDPIEALKGEVLPPLRAVPAIAIDHLRLWEGKIQPDGMCAWALAMLCHAKDIHSVLVTLDDRSFIAVNLIRYVMLNLPPAYILEGEPGATDADRTLRAEWRGWVGGDV